MATVGGAEHACKTRRLVILLLLLTLPAAVQYSRHAHRLTGVISVEPQRAVYELLGDSARPGIYRFTREQTTAALAAACGAHCALVACTGDKIAPGTRLTFSGSATASADMDAPALLAYGLPVSLATASGRDLELIPGIGPKTARAIIDYRDRTGPVQRIEELINIRGIGPKTLENIAPFLRP
jgi:competence ComEA-like helix-hairpin-helix protein